MLMSMINIYAQLRNGSFEDSDIGVNYWNFRNSDTIQNQISIDHTTFFHGSKSIKLSKGNVQSQLFAHQHFAVSVTRPTKIKIQGFYKSERIGAKGNLYLNIFDSSGKTIGSSHKLFQKNTIGAEWNKIELETIIDSSATSLVLMLNSLSTDDIWFDDIVAKTITTPPSSTIIDFAHEVMDKIKQQSLFADSIDWHQVEANLAVNLSGYSDEKNYEQVVEYFLSELHKVDDKHSFYQNTQQYQDYSTKPIEQAKNQLITPIGHITKDHIGYIKVPSFGSTYPESVQKFADSLNFLIENIAIKKPKGWIVDLSENNGGNMYPMILGLYKLIGDGPVLSFITKEKKTTLALENGTLNHLTLRLPSKPLPNPKIALITSPLTASSGEMTLISFLGRPAVRTFGLQTAGMVTANSFVELSDDSAISLASSYVEDRYYKSYKSSIRPDIELKQAKNIEEVIQIAADWILETDVGHEFH